MGPLATASELEREVTERDPTQASDWRDAIHVIQGEYSGKPAPSPTNISLNWQHAAHLLVREVHDNPADADWDVKQ
jgi:hypothetical protein